MRAAWISMIAVVALVTALDAPRAASARPVVFLDGDQAVRSLNSEEFLLTQNDPARATHEFGSAVAFGDVDGDGLADAVVGQRTENRVFVFLGSTAPGAAPYFSDPNAADIVINAPAGTADAVGQFGFSVAVFDLDGDLYGDIIVGAPFSDPAGKKDAGRAFVVLGQGNLATGQEFTVGSPPPGVTVLTLTRGAAAKAGDLLGFAVGGATLGTLGDTYLVVTARDADRTSPSLKADTGAAHVVFGSTLPVSTSTVDLSSDSAVTLFGIDAADAFGEAVASCDVDGNGDDDLLVGAIFGDGPANAGLNRGEALLFLGENIASGHFTGEVSASSADMAIHGSTNGDDMGYSVACGDLDGDGLGDMVAGAIFADSVLEARPTAGEVYVLKGRTSQIDPNSPARRELVDPNTGLPQAPVNLSIVSSPASEPSPDGADLALLGATTADQLGFSVTVGDLDGDGIGDLLAGARRYDKDQTRVNVGATYVMLGSPGFLDPASSGMKGIDLHRGTARTVDSGYDPNTPVDHLPDRVDTIIVGASRDDHSAFTLAAGDLNGDGAAEILIGAIGDLTREPDFRGEAYILTLSDRDGDGASDLLDLDNDNDGIGDEDELSGTFTGGQPTDPLDPDTDRDGIQDGTELGFTCQGGGGVEVVSCDDPNAPFTSTDPGLSLFFKPDSHPDTVTDPLDQDSDDDGLPDGCIDGANAGPLGDGNCNGVEGEDFDGDGMLDSPGESDASNHDTDADGLTDGVERGLTGGGVPGLDGIPDAGPFEDGTDPTSPHFRTDADAGASRTDPISDDSDFDGIEDGTEDSDLDGAVAGDLDLNNLVDPLEIWSETDASDSDTDADGIVDGLEDRDADGALDAGESNPLDQDSDDDGLADGMEDADHDGIYGIVDGESSPALADTDGDGLPDGLEAGLMGAGVAGRNGTPDGGPGEDGTDTTSPSFVLDADAGASTTSPRLTDSDGDGITDGVEDADGNGAVAGDADLDHIVDATEIWTETDPAAADTDLDGLRDGQEDADGDGVVDPGESNPLDQDTDDDGLPDGWVDGANGQPVDGIAQPLEGEDRDRDGVFGPNDKESSPVEADLDGDGQMEADSDGDGLLDGVELGLLMGGGVNGRNGTPDGGPGGDGTDVTSPNFRPDGDPNAPATDPWDADTDNDGLPDGFIDGYNPNSTGMPAEGGMADGAASVYEGEDIDLDGALDPGETDPIFRDTDGDGVKDGTERGVTSPGVLGPDGLPDPPSGGVQDGTGGPALEFDLDDATLTPALDADADDDGLSDGTEDINSTGFVDGGETDPGDPDTDGDLLTDGLELGIIVPVIPDTDPNAGNFTPDQDPNTITFPTVADSDGGGTVDGLEDANRNGRVDAGEQNPENYPGDDDRSGVLEFTDVLNGMTVGSLTAGAPIFLRLDDDGDENLSPLAAETVSVTCVSSFPDTKTTLLTAVSITSAVFVGSLATNTSDPNTPAELAVGSGDTVTCTYTDDEDPIDVRFASLTAAATGSPAIPQFDIEISASGTISWAPSEGSGAPPPGPMTYNLYLTTPAALRASGIYTLASVACGLAQPQYADGAALQPGNAFLYLATGRADGVEGSLGEDSLGRPRPFTVRCEP